MTMLLDFYGELLTEKQREYFDLYHNEDLTLSEIADKTEISKQGVHDAIARATMTLEDIERKTGLMQRWSETRGKLIQAAGEGVLMHPAVVTYFQMKNSEEKELGV